MRRSPTCAAPANSYNQQGRCKHGPHSAYDMGAPKHIAQRGLRERGDARAYRVRSAKPD